MVMLWSQSRPVAPTGLLITIHCFMQSTTQARIANQAQLRSTSSRPSSKSPKSSPRWTIANITIDYNELIRCIKTKKHVLDVLHNKMVCGDEITMIKQTNKQKQTSWGAQESSPFTTCQHLISWARDTSQRSWIRHVAANLLSARAYNSIAGRQLARGSNGIENRETLLQMNYLTQWTALRPIKNNNKLANLVIAFSQSKESSGRQTRVVSWMQISSNCGL